MLRLDLKEPREDSLGAKGGKVILSNGAEDGKRLRRKLRHYTCSEETKNGTEQRVRKGL